MKIFVTGATGYVGSALIRFLLAQHHTIHVLIRRKSTTGTLNHPGIRVFKGDLLSKEDVADAMKNCDQVYHTAALVKMWVKNEQELYAQNVTVTRQLLQIASDQQVSGLVFTSTCGVWPSGEMLTERDPQSTHAETYYDFTKAEAEQYVKEYARKGLPAVIANLSRVYGPGPARPSAGINRFIQQLLTKRVVPMPWNIHAKGNYVFIDDAARGLMLAMEKGKAGENYILGGENISYAELRQKISELSGHKNILLRIPAPILLTWSSIELFRGNISSHEPMLTPRLVKRLQADKTFDCSKAIAQLGYSITPFTLGLQKTIKSLQGKVK